jgi:hypothetical protein
VIAISTGVKPAAIVGGDFGVKVPSPATEYWEIAPS